MPRQIAAPIALALAACLGSSQLSPAQAVVGRTSHELRRHLDTVEAQLREGKISREPLDLTFVALLENRITGEQELRLAARAFVLRGLAAAAEGRTVDAGIDWSAAVGLVPEFAEFDLTPYGAMGEALRRAAEDARQVGARSVEAKTLGQAGTRAPRMTRDGTIQVPHYLCSHSRAEIDVWLDETGAVRGFANPEATCDRGLILTTISGLRQRRYEAGKNSEGEPIATSLRVTVKFTTGLESLLD